MTNMTAVQKMFNAFAKGSWKTMSRTREKANHVWSDFWFLLIKSGFAFEKTDLVSIREYCNESRYNPPWYGVDEGHYSLAVRCGNLTFAYALEKLWGRKPFIGFGLDYYDCWPRYSKHSNPATMGRLVISVRFQWQGEKVSVTSFNDKKHSLVACAYRPNNKAGYASSKIIKRFTITAKDFKQEMSKRRKSRGKDAR